MKPLTPFLARLLGLFFIVTSIALLVRKDATAVITGVAHDGPLLLVLAMVTLVAGLAMVLAHNIWSGGILPIVITLIGWLLLIRGAMLMILPAQVIVRLFDALSVRNLYYPCVVSMLLGLYLTYAGFRR